MLFTAEIIVDGRDVAIGRGGYIANTCALKAMFTEKFFCRVQQSVLNISSTESLQEVLKHKLPAAGALIIGYFLGLKKS